MLRPISGHRKIVVSEQVLLDISTEVPLFLQQRKHLELDQGFQLDRVVSDRGLALARIPYSNICRQRRQFSFSSLDPIVDYPFSLFPDLVKVNTDRHEAWNSQSFCPLRMIGVADRFWEEIIWGLETFEGAFRYLGTSILSSLIRCAVQGIAYHCKSLLRGRKGFSLRWE